MVVAECFDLGKTDYSETFVLQKRLAEKRIIKSIPDTILVSEHYPVVNFGMREVDNTFSDSLREEIEKEGADFCETKAIDYLRKRGIGFSRTSRGGGATFIGEGQINFYPIVNYEKIAQAVMGIDRYKEIIDSIMYSVLKSYGLNVEVYNVSRRDEGDDKNSIRKDVWLREDGKDYKLGGKGIHISKGVAYHGFNFYVKKGSAKGFRYVNPCGCSPDELGVISVEEALGREVSLEDFKGRVLDEIKIKFGYEEIKRAGKLEIC
jgi:lipoate-protein ligase B